MPTSDDFRKLKKYIQSQKKTYQEVYAPIRHHFGHRIYIKNEEIQVLFNKVKIKDIEKFYVRLYGVHEALWQLYHNGRGPLLPIREKKYSTKNILKSRYKQHEQRPANVQFVEEVKIALKLLKTGLKEGKPK